jgi:hypothetical protein
LAAEFKELPAEVQVGLMQTNGTAAVFLILAHLELSSTGLEQLKVKYLFYLCFM